MYFAAVIAIALSFLGCRHTPSPTPVMEQVPVMIPLTDSIITEFGGLDEMSKFQFYISKSVTLQIDDKPAHSIIQEGIGIRSGYMVHDTISFKAFEPGLLMDIHKFPTMSPDTVFNVAFEHHAGSPVIHFAKQGSGSNDRYEIVYDDKIAHKINYGSMPYLVEFLGDEQPYLMVKILEYVVKTDASRDTPGLTFD